MCGRLKIKRFAAARIRSADPDESLADGLEGRLDDRLLERPLVPWGLTVGVDTPAWDGLAPDQQLVFGWLRRGALWHGLSDPMTRGQELRMCRRAIPRLYPLRGVDRDLLRCLIDGHFAAETATDRARSAAMPKLNERIVTRAALSEDERAAWRRQLTENQGWLQFFPSEALPAREGSVLVGGRL